MGKELASIRNSLDWEGNTRVLKLHHVKTDASERNIKLPKLVVEALKIEKRRKAENKLRAGGMYRDEGFVWAWDDGRPHDPDFLYRKFQKLIRDYNKKIENDQTLSAKQKKEQFLPTIRFHDLRHSHATVLLLAGVPVKVISERLGHSSIDITQDIYSHVLPQIQDQAAHEIDAMLTKNTDALGTL